MQSALRATAALYEQTIDSLVQLGEKEISSVFTGAKTCELLLQPGTTTLDIALKAGCFSNERMLHINIMFSSLHTYYTFLEC